SIPATCRALARSRSIAQEQSSTNAGVEELSSTALTALVVLRPAYTSDWNSATPRKESRTSSPIERRTAGQFARRRGSAKGASASAATDQRQRLSATGSKASRSARPITQLPAQNSDASASIANAAPREDPLLFKVRYPPTLEEPEHVRPVRRPAHQARERRSLHPKGGRERRRLAQGARMQAVRRARGPEGQDPADALRGVRGREGLRSAPADRALQEVRRRGGAAARLARAPQLEARRALRPA